MKKQNKYCFLVYCNPINPLVYEVFLSKKSAIKYAHSLITWRFDNASKNGYEHGYYCYLFEDGGKTKKNTFEEREKNILYTCLKIKDKTKDSNFSDDGCIVKVVRRMIRK